ncbi:MAG: 23S rRNA (uracil(1939)-C(5))-methyltransferase RlmD [Clostridia bacterium]|nr:23S rRNA (uracil(1939)-C(5))-methyltransferase RlmD [Clostridia bacterium]
MSTISKGSVIVLEIKTTGINGEGIGYYNKLAVFVKGAIQKEKIYAKIEEVYDKYLVASIYSYIEKSNRRVEPFCKYYEECGACNMQHIKMNEQLKIKRQILINSLKRYTPKLDLKNTKIDLTTPSPEIAYRNKSQLPFRDTNFGLALGLYQENTNKFVYIDECPIQNELVNKINTKTLSILRKYKECTPKNGGILKYLCVRALIESKEAQVTFIVTEYKDSLKEIAQELYDYFDEIKTVAYSIQDKNSVSIFGNTTEVLVGRNYIHDDCLGLKVSLSPKAFYQLNKKSSENAFREILASDVDENDIVFDGYSGIGVLGLLFAKKTKHVYSVDFNSDSIKNARIIARENDISNITFYSDRIENRFPKLVEEGITPDIVILDPPRSGLDDKVIDVLNKINAKKIFYVSCNTSTLAKNLNKLLDNYMVESIKPYDFFTETAHVETVCLLTLKNQK